MPSVSSPQSGDFGAGIIDDLNAGTTSPGWTNTSSAGAAAANLSTQAATAALCKFSGGVIWTPTTTVAGVSAFELQGQTLNNANGVGVEADFVMALDTALPSATQAYVVLMGIFDVTGASLTGNFIGLMYGFNPITNTVFNGFMLCADTVARLVGNTPTAQAVAIPLNVVPALDVPNVCRIRVSNAWNLIRGSVNGVNAFPQIGTAGQANIYPNILVPANGIPNITNGWLGIKVSTQVGTAGTGKVLLDQVSYDLVGRIQNS